jgi:putative transposase
MRRKNPLCTGQYYHVYSKSINHFQIFNSPEEYTRFLYLLRYYHYKDLPFSFSQMTKTCQLKQIPLETKITETINNKISRVDIIAYCLMPTHFHLILYQTESQGIEYFIRDLCCAYSHYFNLRHKRKGPLWQNRFGSSCLYTHQEVLETSRYVHLNPSTAYLTNHPAQWAYTSFHEYIDKNSTQSICNTNALLEKMTPSIYEHFVTSYIEEQRQIKTYPDPGSRLT